MGWSLSGFQAVLQLSLFDGVAFDPFPFQENGLAYTEVDVRRRQVLQAFVVAVIVVLDEARPCSQFCFRRNGEGFLI
jgi:hypothetical protein